MSEEDSHSVRFGSVRLGCGKIVNHRHNQQTLLLKLQLFFPLVFCNHHSFIINKQMKQRDGKTDGEEKEMKKHDVLKALLSSPYLAGQ